MRGASTIVESLRGGDRRSIGAANRVARRAAADPRVFADLLTAMRDDDPVMRMRAADAAEKASAIRPERLAPHTRVLLELIAEATQQEVRWHLAQIVPRLQLSPRERREALAAFETYLSDRSAIVKTFAMQALADLAAHDDEMKTHVVRLIRRAATSGTPAMRARGKKLLKILERE